MSIRKTLSLALAIVMVFTLFAGCSNTSNNASPAGTETSSSADASADVSSALSSDVSAEVSAEVSPATSGETVKLKIGASPVPHAVILALAKDELLAAGIELEIVEFTDYIMPNTALETGDIDLNYFQHVPYLDDFNAKNGTHIKAVQEMHFEPYGMYGGKLKSVENIPEGATIAVPNDPSNEARALQLLQANGLIKLKDGVGLQATAKDIIENPKKIVIKELEAAMLPRSLADVDFAIINGNYAIDAGLKFNTDALYKEDVNTEAKKFINVICAKEGRENDPAIKKFLEIITSDKVKKMIEEKYNGAVVPVF